MSTTVVVRDSGSVFFSSKDLLGDRSFVYLRRDLLLRFSLSLARRPSLISQCLRQENEDQH